MCVSATGKSIGDEGAKAIAEALKLISSLQLLYLTCMPLPLVPLSCAPVPCASQCLRPVEVEGAAHGGVGVAGVPSGDGTVRG